jgi:molecular chaperone GrpE
VTKKREHHDERAERRPAEAEASSASPLQNLGGEAPPDDAPEVTAEKLPSTAALEAELAEARDRWLRTEAELQTFRRRAARDREETRRNAEDAMLREWITVIDDLDRALASAAGAEVAESWLAGVRLVAQRMIDLMARYGVQPLDPMGQPFDPTFHEALAEVEASEGAAPGSVVQVIQKGYAREGRALRPARVVVARGAALAGER